MPTETLKIALHMSFGPAGLKPDTYKEGTGTAVPCPYAPLISLCLALRDSFPFPHGWNTGRVLACCEMFKSTPVAKSITSKLEPP